MSDYSDNNFDINYTDNKYVNEGSLNQRKSKLNYANVDLYKKDTQEVETHPIIGLVIISFAIIFVFSLSVSENDFRKVINCSPENYCSYKTYNMSNKLTESYNFNRSDIKDFRMECTKDYNFHKKRRETKCNYYVILGSENTTVNVSASVYNDFKKIKRDVGQLYIKNNYNYGLITKCLFLLAIFAALFIGCLKEIEKNKIRKNTKIKK